MSLSKPEFLKDPNRIRRITRDRYNHQRSFEALLRPAPPMNYRPPADNAKLKEIYLKDISVEPNLYVNRYLELKTIEDPYIYNFASVCTVIVEDKNRDVGQLVFTRLFKSESSIMNLLSFGTVVRVQDPMAGARAYALPDDKDKSKRYCFVDDARAITVLEKKKDMCRYCGEENATLECVDCKRLYCDLECQDADLKILKHKLICEIPYSFE